MLKIIGFIFILFSGISLMIIASLFTGIEINEISYKNIYIKKLYLNYDKKLNVSTTNFSVLNQKQEEAARMRTAFSVDYVDGLIQLDVKEFFLYDTDIAFTGLAYIDHNKINFNDKSSLILKDLIFTFDKQMKKVKAIETYVNFENNIIEATFKKPYYDDVLLNRSKVTYDIKDNTLKLYLKTNSLLNNTIKEVLARYEVEINTIQFNGKNDVSTNIFIPFDEREIFIEADVKILNSTIENYGQKYTVNKSILHYQDQIITGRVDVNNYQFRDLNITNSILDYSIDFTKEMTINASSDKINIDNNISKFHLKNALLKYKKDKIIFTSKIHDNKNKIDMDFRNNIDIKTKQLFGDFDLKYRNKDSNITMIGDKLSYYGDYKNGLNMKINGDDLNITDPLKSQIKNISISIKDREIKTNLLLEDRKKTHKLKIFNTTNLNTKLSYGAIQVDHIQYKNLIDLKDRNIPYSGSFKDYITIDSYGLGLNYLHEYKTKEHKFIISNPGKLLEALAFATVKNKEKGSIDIDATSLKDVKINIDNVDLDIDSSYFESEDQNTGNDFIIPTLPKINLTYTNSDIKYDDYTVSFDTLKLNTERDTLNLNLKKENSIIDLKTKNNSIMFNATNLSDKYVNNFLNKELLEDGYMDINLYGDDINDVSGDVNFYDTTVKNVTIVNSLLTFVNTTPAIFNPLLALPTLFRLAETGFDANGYYLDRGNGSLRFYLPKQELNIYDLYTNGKMSNFIVNSKSDFKTKKIKANVDVSFLKDFTKAIRYIPVIGYIVMGEDGEFHTSVDITGTTDDPILETNTISEATSGVKGIIERVITLPLQPFKEEIIEDK